MPSVGPLQCAELHQAHKAARDGFARGGQQGGQGALAGQAYQQARLQGRQLHERGGQLAQHAGDAHDACPFGQQGVVVGVAGGQCAHEVGIDQAAACDGGDVHAADAAGAQRLEVHGRGLLQPARAAQRMAVAEQCHGPCHAVGALAHGQHEADLDHLEFMGDAALRLEPVPLGQAAFPDMRQPLLECGLGQLAQQAMGRTHAFAAANR